MLKIVASNPKPRKLRRPSTNYVSPENLHNYLDRITTVCVTFGSTSEMQSYRRMLYTINKQGQFRYRTIRDETEAFGILIWRMK